jgi:hypothetical protein
MTTLGTAGVAFYVRFLVALFMEWKPRPPGYSRRSRLGLDAVRIIEERDRRKPETRAA